MLTIKKIGILVIILFFINLQSHAESGTEEQSQNYHSFSLYTIAGFLYGHSEELVYRNGQNDTYLSELLWDLKPHPYIGIGVDFTPSIPGRSGLSALGNIKIGMPGISGIIENRDWLNISNYDLTHYSRHNAVTGFTILTDLSLGYSWALTEAIRFIAYGEFSYMYFSWTARDGYYQHPSTLWGDYPPWNEDLPKINSGGRVITYQQSWFMLSPGIAFNARISSIVSMGLGFSYSPLILCFAKDEHLLRDIIFWDIMYFGNYFNIKGNLLLSPIRNVDLNFSFSYRYINRTRGDTYIRENNRTTAYSNIVGAVFSAMDFTFAVRIPFN